LGLWQKRKWAGWKKNWIGLDPWAWVWVKANGMDHYKIQVVVVERNSHTLFSFPFKEHSTALLSLN